MRFVAPLFALLGFASANTLTVNFYDSTCTNAATNVVAGGSQNYPVGATSISGTYIASSYPTGSVCTMVSNTIASTGKNLYVRSYCGVSAPGSATSTPTGQWSVQFYSDSTCSTYLTQVSGSGATAQCSTTSMLISGTATALGIQGQCTVPSTATVVTLSTYGTTSCTGTPSTQFAYIGLCLPQNYGRSSQLYVDTNGNGQIVNFNDAACTAAQAYSISSQPVPNTCLQSGPISSVLLTGTFAGFTVPTGSTWITTTSFSNSGGGYYYQSAATPPSAACPTNAAAQLILASNTMTRTQFCLTSYTNNVAQLSTMLYVDANNFQQTVTYSDTACANPYLVNGSPLPVSCLQTSQYASQSATVGTGNVAFPTSGSLWANTTTYNNNANQVYYATSPPPGMAFVAPNTCQVTPTITWVTYTLNRVGYCVPKYNGNTIYGYNQISCPGDQLYQQLYTADSVCQNLVAVNQWMVQQNGQTLCTRASGNSFQTTVCPGGSSPAGLPSTGVVYFNNALCQQDPESPATVTSIKGSLTSTSIAAASTTSCLPVTASGGGATFLTTGGTSFTCSSTNGGLMDSVTVTNYVNPTVTPPAVNPTGTSCGVYSYQSSYTAGECITTGTSSSMRYFCNNNQQFPGSAINITPNNLILAIISLIVTIAVYKRA